MSLQSPSTHNTRARIFRTIARHIAPRKRLSVSEHADEHRFLTTKGSSEPGRWVTERNPPLREPMDALSVHSGVHDVVLMFPVQMGKTEVALNAINYRMVHAPCPIMVVLPGEPSMKGWIQQKFNTMVESCSTLREVMRSQASRDSANQRDFKDYAGGQLFIEHAGSTQRLKSKSVEFMVVDELDEFPAETLKGDDPVDMLDDRTSGFPSTYKRLYISSPGTKGVSRIEQKWLESDQRYYEVPCPHCGEFQALDWSGLGWTPDLKHCWYTCQHNGCLIDEHHKTDMIRRGRWIATEPDARTRGYTINGLYYQIGLGPRWSDLVRMWLAAQDNPAKLKTFTNSRLALPYEDPAMRAVKHNLIRDRAEAYPLRLAPAEVLAVTAGCDTQDDRIPVQIIGWGRGMKCWVLDYIEFPGDPAEDATWIPVTELLNKPIEHALGGTIRVEAAAFDMGGHRTEAVKNYVRSQQVMRPMCIFGATRNNAPVLGKPTLGDINWKGKSDKRGIKLWQIGTVAAKHHLYALLSTDADRERELRMVHISDQLEPEYFQGLTAEVYDPKKNRFEVKYKRNEPLDTWVYAYAATHHPELRLARQSKRDWDEREKRLTAKAAPAVAVAPPPPPKPEPRPNPFASSDWSSRR